MVARFLSFIASPLPPQERKKKKPASTFNSDQHHNKNILAAEGREPAWEEGRELFMTRGKKPTEHTKCSSLRRYLKLFKHCDKSIVIEN